MDITNRHVRLEQSKQQLIARARKMEVRYLLADLKMCSSTKNLARGKQIHAETVQNGAYFCIYVATALMKMYAACGSMICACQVFESIDRPDLVAWTTLISGYVDNGESITALDLFARMKSQGYAPDSFSLVAALKACISLALHLEENGRAMCLERGKQIHSEIGFLSDIYVQSTLIDMYVKCGKMLEARRVFDSIRHPNVVAWGALILGYAENGEGITALDLFARMRSRGCAPNSFIYVAALKACTSFALDPETSGITECLERAQHVLSDIGFHSDIYVQSTLVDMYVKCRMMVEARQVFDSIKHPNVVSWTALILGYAENGEGGIALDLYARMKSQGCAPNSFTFVAALKACGLLGALEFGSKIHAEELGSATNRNVIVVTSLVDFYVKCGNLVKAQEVFDSQSGIRDLTTWTALLAGYSCLGDEKTVFELFKGIKDAGLQPNGVTFLCILSCCCHAGLVEKAYELFNAMYTEYGVPPTVEHYTCMVDIFGRSNKLDSSLALLRGMPFKPNVVAWKIVLSACRKWKNVWIGKLAFRTLVSLDDTDAASYVQMANIYGSRGMWEEQEMVLGMRKKLKA